MTRNDTIIDKAVKALSQSVTRSSPIQPATRRCAMADDLHAVP